MKAGVDAKQQVGVDLEWDHNKRELLSSMDECVETALKEFQHASPKQRCRRAPSEAQLNQSVA